MLQSAEVTQIECLRFLDRYADTHRELGCARLYHRQDGVSERRDIVVVGVEKHQHSVSMRVECLRKPAEFRRQLVEKPAHLRVRARLDRARQGALPLMRVYPDDVAGKESRSPMIEESTFGRTLHQNVNGHSGAPSSK
jgi:hypothetical protein